MDFNAWEIVLLLLLAIVFFGPEKLPELARKTARVFAYLRGIANDARTQLREELGPELADIKLSDLNPRNLLASQLGAETTRELNEVAAEMRGVRGAVTQATTGEARPDASPADAPDGVDPDLANLVEAIPPFDREAT